MSLIDIPNLYVGFACGMVIGLAAGCVFGYAKGRWDVTRKRAGKVS